MKSEFLLAFNQICNERNLPRDVVLQALQAALVSAYRRSVNASAAQNIVAEIDSATGAARIYAEKEVVERVCDPHTEVALSEARAVVPDIKLNEMIMVESTPEDFGRVAAQMAKQVILQRIREAERDALYANFSEREGEIINGTVQSISNQGVMLNLGRTEASLPKNQQVPGERYTLHQRLRAYVLEVRKSPRGPQIIVSRNHKNMLRRLFELEVPEIYNGTVEIKSIAREAGARSKIAVAALQSGVDPVGSCVGMKGVRIQSIVNELNGEKIDVIEWSSDAPTYIAKALSPARVLAVYADDDGRHGKTAQVVVPDDQLSLAIGRDGQNARLAAKLTGWRIDIKSASEAATEIAQRAQDTEWVAQLESEATRLISTLRSTLKRHSEYQLPWNNEELQMLRRLLDADNVLQVARRREERARARAEAAAQRARAESVSPAEPDAEIKALMARIPEAAQSTLLSTVGLSERVLKHLRRAKLTTVDEILRRLAAGDEAMLSVEGIGPKALAEIKSQIETSGLWFMPEVAAPAEAKPVEPTEEIAPAEEGIVAEHAEEVAPAETAPEMAIEPEAPLAEAPIVSEEETVAPLPGPEIVEAPTSEEAISPEAAEEEPTPPPRPRPTLEPEAEEEDEDEDEDEEPLGKGDRKKKGKGKRRDRKLVYDEKLGMVVARRKRKPGRRRDVWELDEDL